MVRAPGAPEALQFSVRGSGTVAFGSYPQAPKEGIRPLHESSTAPTRRLSARRQHGCRSPSVICAVDGALGIYPDRFGWPFRIHGNEQDRFI